MKEPPKDSKPIRLALKILEPMPGNRELGSGMDKKSLGELAAKQLGQSARLAS